MSSELFTSGIVKKATIEFLNASAVQILTQSRMLWQDFGLIVASFLPVLAEILQVLLKKNT